MNELLEQAALRFVEAICRGVVSGDFSEAERWLSIALTAAADSREALLGDPRREDA